MARILPFVMMLISAMIVAFGVGVAITEFKIPPYRSIAEGAKTLRWSVEALRAPPYVGQFIGPAEGIAPEEAAAARFEGSDDAALLPGTILAIGGLNEYLEICPGDGCIAVEIGRDGTILHGYPYKPDEIFAADITGGSFYREGQPPDPRQIKRPIGMRPLPGGDVVVSFQTTGPMFPFSGGIARIGRDGTPRWYRFDYSHHWVNLMPDGRVIVPDLVIAEGDWRVPLGPNGNRRNMYCETGRPQVDGVHILDPETGAVDQRIDVEAALRASPWAGLLANTFDPCDPLHINYVDMLDETAPGGAVAPGHLVVSLRNLDLLAVIDPDSGTVTRVVRGSFQQQHSAQQLVGSKVLLFDNWGGSGAQTGAGSRVLEIDLVTGAERQVFPAPGTPPRPELYSHRAGHLSISPDRTRTLISFTEAATGIEAEIATGRQLLSYRSLHDLRGVEGASEALTASAARAKLFGMYYVEP